jgi:hypothetical protein
MRKLHNHQLSSVFYSIRSGPRPGPEFMEEVKARLLQFGGKFIQQRSWTGDEIKKRPGYATRRSGHGVLLPLSDHLISAGPGDRKGLLSAYYVTVAVAACIIL